MSIVAVILDDARPEYLKQCVESLTHVTPIDTKILCDDSGDPSYADYLGWSFTQFDEQVHNPRRFGLAGALRSAWTAALEYGPDYVFHCEGDFVFEYDIDLGSMVHILDANPLLAQVSLKRQPGNDHEAAAGGFIQTALDQYWQQSGYVSHRACFTFNPCLVPRIVVEMCLQNPGAGLEKDFTDLLVSHNYHFGIYGTIEDAASRHPYRGPARKGLDGMSVYDAEFFTAETREAYIAARIILPWILHRTQAKSVIDIGCGTGAWLRVAKDTGCGVYGIDGNAPDDALLINPEEFERSDLTDGIPCEGYDLAMCLEVGEHLPSDSAYKLVNGLCQAKYVFWSAAVPGQRGVDHINEQWPTWWAEYFRDNGYYCSSDVRDVFWEETAIAPFYRQNICVYAKPHDLLHAGMTISVRNDVHPDNPHIPCPSH